MEINLCRLDAFLVMKGCFKSRDRANAAVQAGQIKVNGKVVTKPALLIGDADRFEVVQGDFGYVGRGALKLEEAVKEWRIAAVEQVCLDIGVATGGFSDFLLQNGAKLVYGVDVGEGQIAKEMVGRPGFVFRNFTDGTRLQPGDFEQKLDLIVVDVSFISIARFFPALARISSRATKILLLIKPQFELGKTNGAAFKDKKLIQNTLAKLQLGLAENGLESLKTMLCPVKGKEGNQEYWWLVRKAED